MTVVTPTRLDYKKGITDNCLDCLVSGTLSIEDADTYSNDLLLNATNWKDLSGQTDFTSHGKVLADWGIAREAHQCGYHGDTGGGAILKRGHISINK